MIKIAALGLITVLLAIQFRAGKAEYSTYLAFAGCLVIFFYGILKLESILDALKRVQGFLSIHDMYITLLLKIVGITYIAEFAADLCKDAGYGAIAGQIEFVGKLTILTMSMPVLLSLLESVQKFF